MNRPATGASGARSWPPPPRRRHGATAAPILLKELKTGTSVAVLRPLLCPNILSRSGRIEITHNAESGAAARSCIGESASTGLSVLYPVGPQRTLGDTRSTVEMSITRRLGDHRLPPVRATGHSMSGRRPQRRSVRGRGGGVSCRRGLVPGAGPRPSLPSHVQLVTVVAVLSGAVPVAGFGVDHRDDLFGGHTLGDSHAAFPVVFDVLGRDDLSAGQERQEPRSGRPGGP